MKKLAVKFKRLTPEATMPRRAHPNDAGLDLVVPTRILLGWGERKAIPTSLAIELPDGLIFLTKGMRCAILDGKGEIMDLIELQHRFDSEGKCRGYLEKKRWPNGVQCPRCHATTISRLKDYHRFECSVCEYQFTVTSGTIMHRTHIPICKWLISIHLMCESKKGISANQLKRHIGVTYKTAWYLAHRIRNAMKHTDVEDKLGGILEADEVYIGGKGDKPGRPSLGSKKTPVVGIVERGGRVKCVAMPNLSLNNVFEFVRRSIAQDAVEVIYTDQWGGYRILKHFVPHKTVNHRITFVDGPIHTNTIESFWSLLKRGIVGAFHHISVKHLDRYLAEFSWRFNQRKEEDILSSLLGNVERTHVRYAEMVS